MAIGTKTDINVSGNYAVIHKAGFYAVYSIFALPPSSENNGYSSFGVDQRFLDYDFAAGDISLLPLLQVAKFYRSGFEPIFVHLLFQRGVGLRTSIRAD